MAPVAQTVSSLLLGFALCFMLLAVSLNHWHGGNLFDYAVPQDADRARACAALFVTGTILWTAAFILGLVRFCSPEELSGHRGIGISFILALYLGTALNIIAMLVYTAVLGEEWSFLFAATAWVASLVVSCMGSILCRCDAKRS